MTKPHRAERVRRRSFLSHLLRAAPIIVAVTAMTAYADQRMHLFDSLQMAGLDAFAATSAATSSDVVLVTIGDDDYRKMFDNRSPLDAGALRTIIGAVLKQSPAVLGVDISTADANDANLRDVISQTKTAVVWARDAFTRSTPSRDATWELDRVLGADDPPGGATVGLSTFPQDADRLVRGYYRHVPLKSPGGDAAPASLAWAVVEAYCPQKAPADPQQDPRGCANVRERARLDTSKKGSEEPLRFNFAGESYTFRKVAAGAVEAAPPGLFEHRIVLIGGTFAAGRDLYATPLGQMFGVELTAMAIEVELNGGGVTTANEVLMVAMDLAAGVLLVWINWRWNPASRLTVAITAGAIVGLAVLASYVAFRGAGYWANFVPVGIGVWLHSFYDRAREADALRQELEECRKRHVTTR